MWSGRKGKTGPGKQAGAQKSSFPFPRPIPKVRRFILNLNL
jgi:hypothetical protein